MAVQLNPRKAIAKIKVGPYDEVDPKLRGRDFYRILGLTGLGTGILGQTDEAESSPIGKAFKLGQKAMGSLSSSSGRLAGKTLQGKVIKEVRRGKGDWRQIVFNDDSVLPVTKDYVHSLARAKGTEDYLSAYAGKNREGKLTQALNSMAMHERLFDTMSSRERVRTLQGNYLKKAQELDPSLPPDTVMVTRGTKYYSMPRVYAEQLQKAGILTIREGQREKRMLKPFRKEK
jgi:hypothetical protein